LGLRAGTEYGCAENEQRRDERSAGLNDNIEAAIQDGGEGVL